MTLSEGRSGDRNRRALASTAWYRLVCDHSSPRVQESKGKSSERLGAKAKATLTEAGLSSGFFGSGADLASCSFLPSFLWKSIRPHLQEQTSSMRMRAEAPNSPCSLRTVMSDELIFPSLNYYFVSESQRVTGRQLSHLLVCFQNAHHSSGELSQNQEGQSSHKDDGNLSS